ncbi:MAG: hypothetical protein AMK73_06050, partial [Planctomycetes bacterium SM23_32]
QAAAGPAAGAEATSGAGDWAGFASARDVMVRAEDVAELTGAMTLEEGQDNEEVTTESGERATVRYVWCEDDGLTEKDADEQGAAAPAQDHSALFELTIPAGRTYYPWIRVWWQDSCGDSIIITCTREGGPAHEFVVQGSTHQRWHWLPVAGDAGVDLAEGPWRLTVRNREDGARLSRVLFCTRSYRRYKPETPEG